MAKKNLNNTDDELRSEHDSDKTQGNPSTSKIDTNNNSGDTQPDSDQSAELSKERIENERFAKNAYERIKRGTDTETDLAYAMGVDPINISDEIKRGKSMFRLSTENPSVDKMVDDMIKREVAREPHIIGTLTPPNNNRVYPLGASNASIAFDEAVLRAYSEKMGMSERDIDIILKKFTADKTDVIMRCLGGEQSQRAVDDLRDFEAARKLAEAQHKVHTGRLQERSVSEQNATDLEFLGKSPFSSAPDAVYRILDQLPKTWLAQLRRYNKMVTNSLKGRDAFGKRLHTYEKMDLPQGRQSLRSLMCQMIYGLSSLPFTLPVFTADQFGSQDFSELNIPDLSYVKTWNLDKYINYISYIRDQISLLPISQQAFQEQVNLNDFANIMHEQFEVNISGNPAKATIPTSKDALRETFEAYLWQGFNRALINSVITPSIRSLAVGSSTGMVKLSDVDPFGAAVVYTTLQQLGRRKAPSTFITTRIFEYLKKAGVWISDCQILAEISSEGVKQSAPFVLSMLSRACDDPKLLDLANIQKVDTIEPDEVSFSILGLKVKRTVDLRNIYGDPVHMKDAVYSNVYDSIANSASSASIARLIGLLAFFEGIDFMTDLNESHLARYLTLSGVVASNRFRPMDIEKDVFFPLLRDMSKLYFLSDVSSGKTATDDIAQYFNVSGASMQALSDYSTAMMALSCKSVKRAIRTLLLVFYKSREFHDLPIWDECQNEWKVPLQLDEMAPFDTDLTKTLVKEYFYGPAMTEVRAGTVTGKFYFIDDKLESNPDLITPDTKEYFAMLKALGVDGRIHSEVLYHRYFANNFPTIVDAAALMASRMTPAEKYFFASDTTIKRSDDVTFSGRAIANGRRICNLSFFSPTQQASEAGLVTIVKNDVSVKDLLEKGINGQADSDKLAFRGSAYAVTANVEPFISVEFSDSLAPDDIAHFPIRFMKCGSVSGDMSSTMFDSIYGLNWRDDSHKQLLRLADLSYLIDIKDSDSFTLDERVKFVLPCTVDEFRLRAYELNYDITQTRDVSPAGTDPKPGTTPAASTADTERSGEGSTPSNASNDKKDATDDGGIEESVARLFGK